MVCFVLNTFRRLYTTEQFYLDEKLMLSYQRTDLSSFSPKSLPIEPYILIFTSYEPFHLGSIKFVLNYFSGSKMRPVYSSSWLALLSPICLMVCK